MLRQDYEFLQQNHDFKPEWWLAAYTVEDDLVGFIQPVRFLNSDEGNIAYLGTVPEMRGNGYGIDLLSKATSLLLDGGIENIIARTDSQNRPMQRIFAKLNYKLTGQVQVYKCLLIKEQEE